MTAQTEADLSLLDNPAWHSLRGVHQHLSSGTSRVRRYRPTISPFFGVADLRDQQTWTDLATLAGPGQEVSLSIPVGDVPDGWSVPWSIPGVQMVATARLEARPDPEALVLGKADVDEMLDLVERTRPGPFRAETYLLGTYLGIRRDGKLVAMAGERLHPPGWTEISAVCTDDTHRGQGLATRLILAVAHGIRIRGETPFLHTSASNTNAIALYEHLGFRHRHGLRFTSLRTPGATTIQAC